MADAAPRVSVLMPTYRQAAFIRRALESLRGQTLADWELLIVDDGSPDETPRIVGPYLADRRIRYERLEANRGLGGALNHALEQARAPLIAYLPSDDVYWADHLQSLVALLAREPDAVLAYSGVRHHFWHDAQGEIAFDAGGTTQLGVRGAVGTGRYPLQLAQVLHRLTADRWVERDELVTDDLDRMYWSGLRRRGAFVGTGLVTCEWVDHADQLHKAIRETTGGINPFRRRYRIRHPMRYHSSERDLIDEVELYRPFRDLPDTPMATDGLKILLVGELAYNAERILALEERGHKLYGLWTSDGWWFNTVGPLPFGHVEDLPREGWQDAVRRIKPDVIYGLLNWQAIRWAHHVLTERDPAIPFVWHFKEGPFLALERGLWRELVELLSRSDGQVYSSPEMRDWFVHAVPAAAGHDRTLVLDGDLPKREWFTDDRRPRLSQTEGGVHTVVPGRPIGLYPEIIGELARADVHVHFYGLGSGTANAGIWQGWYEQARRAAPEHLHLHPTVHQADWVSELSRYDAGWLHLLPSRNGGDVRRANWDDLNYPARLSTLMAAGLPLLQRDNDGHIFATQTLARELDVGLFYSDAKQLRAELTDDATMARVWKNAWRRREQFTFDYHADRLIAFFRDVIGRRSAGGGAR